MSEAKSAAEKIHEVLIWILEGASEHEIRETIKREWPDEESTPLIVSALQQMEMNADATQSRVKSWSIEATKRVYQRSMEIGEFGQAMRAIRQVADLAAEDEPSSKGEPSRLKDERPLLTIGVLHDADVDDIRRQLADRIARLSENAGGPASARLVVEGTRRESGTA